MNMDVDVKKTLVERMKAFLEKDGTRVNADVSEVKFRLLTIQYDDLTNITFSPLALQKKKFENPTGATIRSAFDISKESSDQFSWSVNEGLKLGTQAEFSAGVPLIGESKVTATVELNVGAEQTSSRTETRRWQEHQEIEVPPFTNVEAQFIVSEGEVHTPFQATIQAYGKIGITFLNKDGTSSSWGGTLEQGWGSLPPAPKFPVLASDNDRLFTVKGTFHAKVGIESQITTRPIELIGETKTPV